MATIRWILSTCMEHFRGDLALEQSRLWYMASSAVPAEGRERIVPTRWYNNRFGYYTIKCGGKQRKNDHIVEISPFSEGEAAGAAESPQAG